MNIDEKRKIVEDLSAKFTRSKVVIVTDYKGLDVTTINDLRRKLRSADIEYRVAKNSILIRAAEGTDVTLIKDWFKGPSAVALSYDDPVAPAKVLTLFAKEHKMLEIKAGVLNGNVLDVQAIQALSVLPSREVLLGQVLSAMQGVPTALVNALSNIPGRLLNVLQAIKDQKAAA